MTIVPLPQRTGEPSRCWTQDELRTLVSVFETHAHRGDASAWDVGATELHEPQFYVVGPAPRCECVLTISRVGRTYVLDDGAGHLLQESCSIESIAGRARQPIGRNASLVARVVVVIAALRLSIEEKCEQLLVEGEELLLPIAPQFAALV
jgi:hypothetical protein